MILPKLCVCYVISRLVLSFPAIKYSAYDVAYTQLRQNHFGLPEDGASEAPKHVGAS
jgi:hypothetical protein